ncbi:MAG: hypothetical protein R6V77_07215 [Candidatus Cloacimonadaceae bacterium]
MNICQVNSTSNLKVFFNITKAVYAGNPFYRATDDSIVKLIVKGPTVFHTHATVKPFLIMQDNKPAGRFALIHDRKQPDYLQVAFFEAMPGLVGVAGYIMEQAMRFEPHCRQIIFGLNGHLNYSAGMLMNHYELPPVFGLPCTPPYYIDYFRDFSCRPIVSYRFSTQSFYDFYDKMGENPDLGGITVRPINKSRLKQEVGIYNYLNNECFKQHPFWAERTAEEDYELFHPFRWLLRKEFFLFAEFKGKPIGFALWYPDFNELVKNHQQLGLIHLAKYHLHNPIRTFRFTQIAVLPEFSNTKATLALIRSMIPPIRKAGYLYGEGGFIFEDNTKCVSMTHRFLQRATGKSFEPFRRFALFEGSLT